jgi:putative oxidoreductase
MKRENIIEVLAFALFFLFVYASSSKLISFNFFQLDLQRSPALGKYAIPISILIPSFELIVSGLLLFEKTKTYGFIGSVILMTIFTIYVGWVLFFTKERPCSCGGIIRNLNWQNHMIFNIFFLLLSISGIYLQRKRVKLSMHNY